MDVHSPDVIIEVAQAPRVRLPPESRVGATSGAVDVADWLDQAGMEMRRGELLSAVDIAERGLAEHPDSLVLQHCSVLALARAGATDEAARRYQA